MSFRSLDNNNDWNFGKGHNDFVTENREVVLNIRTRLKEWVNDCFFNAEAGIDWANRLGSFDQRGLLEQDIKRIILQTENVIELLEFSADFDNATRQLTTNYRARTIFSDTVNDFIQQVI